MPGNNPYGYRIQGGKGKKQHVVGEKNRHHERKPQKNKGQNRAEKNGKTCKSAKKQSKTTKSRTKDKWRGNSQPVKNRFLRKRFGVSHKDKEKNGKSIATDQTVHKSKNKYAGWCFFHKFIGANHGQTIHRDMIKASAGNRVPGKTYTATEGLFLGLILSHNVNYVNFKTKRT